MKQAHVSKKYEFVVVATDVVICTVRDGELQVLLIKMKKHPYEKSWALPGGLIGSNESVDAAAKRQLKEKTGVDTVYLEQLFTFGDVKRDPFGRVVSVAYFALIPSDNIRLQTTDQYGGVDWFPVCHLPQLAYDHREIIRMAVARLKSKLTYSNIAYSLLPKRFAITELQHVYEVILEHEIDKRNFRKKILSLDIIRPTGELQSGVKNRPAELFEFTSRRPQIVEML